MRISVVIPAVNEAMWIERSVRSSRLAGFDEVIVADGGSDDGTPRLASASGAKVVHSGRGRAVQQNSGAREATGDVCCFCTPIIGSGLRLASKCGTVSAIQRFWEALSSNRSRRLGCYSFA